MSANEIQRLQAAILDLEDENKRLKYDLDNVSKKYLLLITEFRKHLEQDEKEK